ncbi:MAG: serine/threonine-protein kinase, partial [Micromonosporaceae bacterium]
PDSGAGERTPHRSPGGGHPSDAAATASPTWARQETLPPTAPPQSGTGTPLGSRYLLDEVIGTGATGRVWRGRRRDDHSPVAVKVLRADFSAEPDSVVRFLRERTTLRALDHPHLVRVHDLVAEGETLAIVMDLVDGEDLRRLAPRGVLDRAQVLVVLHQVASALAAVHAAGVVHRDVKPENVLVSWPSGAGAAPRARLTDFGLAWAADGPLVTRASQLVGTPAYVAPELVAGRRAGHPSDVYALGITGYELLAGRRPFHAEHTAALLRAHLDTDPSRPPGLEDHLWELLRRCLAKRPEDRPTASEVAHRYAQLAGVAVTPTHTAPPLAPDLPAVPVTPHPAAPPVPPGFEMAGSGQPSADAGGARAAGAGEGGVTWPPDVGRTGALAMAADGARHPRETGQAPADKHASYGESPALATNSQVTSGHITSSQVASGVWQAQPTTGATRPAPTPPAEAAPRRRRGLIITAIVVCAVLGLGAGLWFGRPTGKAPKVTPSATGPKVQQYFLTVFGTSPEPGKVTLRFTDMSKEPGFYSYTVFRDSFKIGSAGAGESVPPYRVSNVDARTEHCYTVVALIETTKPPPSAPPEPACLVADGKTR